MKPKILFLSVNRRWGRGFALTLAGLSIILIGVAMMAKMGGEQVTGISQIAGAKSLKVEQYPQPSPGQQGRYGVAVLICALGLSFVVAPGHKKELEPNKD